MKPPFPKTILCALAVMLAHASGFAADAPAWQVRADVQIVEVPLAPALELVPKLQNRETSAAAFEKLQEMIGRDEAELIDWPVANLASPGEGSRAFSGNSTEFRAPSEYNPPGIPMTFSIGPPPPGPWGSLTPTAFETRNLGQSLQFSAWVSGDGRRIAIDIAPKFMRLLGISGVFGGKSPVGIETVQISTEFASYHFPSGIDVTNGDRIVLGSFLEEKPKRVLLLYLLKAVATPAGTMQPVTNEPPEAAPIEIEMQVVSLPSRIAWSIVPELRKKTSIDDACRRLQQLLANGTATLIAWPVLNTASGRRSEIPAESGVRNASEYDPLAIQHPFEEQNQNAGFHLRQRPSAASVIRGIPSDWQSIDEETGLILAATPTLSTDRKTIQVEIDARRRWLKGMLDLSLSVLPAGRRVSVEQPRFCEIRTETRFSLQNGERKLLSATVVPDREDRVEISLIRAATSRAVTVPPPP